VTAASGTARSTFPRTARLRKPHEFQATFAQGKRLHASPFRLHVFLAPAAVASQDAHTGVTEPGPARLGISVPKRVAALAVERNRIRRIARDHFRRERASLPSGDYVLLAQREAAGAAPQALRDALEALWQRARALKPARPAPTMPIPASPPAASDPQSAPIPDR